MEWEDFIGQEQITKELWVTAVSGWKGNILLRGNYGHGKTTLAKLYMSKLGNFYYYDTPSNLKDINLRARQGKHIIVDEIHLLKRQEYLYDAMGQAGNMVFCTTDAGDLSEAFKSRCIEMRLKPYTDREIAAIIYTTLARAATLLEISQAEYLAHRAHGNPRVAINLADRAYRMIVYDGREFNLANIENQLTAFGIDQYGYDDRHRAYITYLMAQDKPVGLKSLSIALDLSQSDLRNEVEAALMRNGHIEITARGRRLKR